MDPATVGMVEAHGTGTPVGDPIEYASLAEVYGVDGPCALGSVKTNFGHTQSTAGALGLMKAILAVEHGLVPPNLHFNTMPDDMAEIETNLFVAQEVTPWPTIDAAGPRRAAVSSYGMSGTNVHAMIEQAPAAQPVTVAEPDGRSGLEGILVFPLSASSEDALRETAARLADWVDAQEDLAISDLAYTLARRRGHRQVRTAVLASTPPSCPRRCAKSPIGRSRTRLRSARTAAARCGCFPDRVRSGPRWARTCWPTSRCSPPTIAEIEPLIAEESGFSVTEAMTAPEMVTGIDRVQPTLFAMQVALAATMKAYGVHPGRSSATRWVSPRRQWSPGRCRSKTACG